MAAEPELSPFPAEELPEFVDAPELEALAGIVIGKWDEFRPIAHAVDDREISIAFVWETKPFDPAKDEIEPHIIAKVTKAGALWRCLTDRHLVIQFRRWFWDRLDTAQREAVVYHELTHIRIGRAQDGSLRLALRKHDLEEFNAVVRRYGAIIPGRRSFITAYEDWQHEQQRPEPTPLRSLPGEQLAKAEPAEGES